MVGRIEKQIIVKLQYEGVHRWKDCNIESVLYLKDFHRHIFYIEVRKQVRHNDRDIEIIRFKHNILKYLDKTFDNFFGDMSCEDIAEVLMNEFELSYVKVLEDNENGALMQRT